MHVQWRGDVGRWMIDWLEAADIENRSTRQLILQKPLLKCYSKNSAYIDVFMHQNPMYRQGKLRYGGCRFNPSIVTLRSLSFNNLNMLVSQGEAENIKTVKSKSKTFYASHFHFHCCDTWPWQWATEWGMDWWQCTVWIPSITLGTPQWQGMKPLVTSHPQWGREKSRHAYLLVCESASSLYCSPGSPA